MRARLFLVGFMGCGKSSVGPLLAERMGLPFQDLDALVERESGMAIVEIFQRQGEASFREAESRLLESLLAGPPSVVALGGGAFSAASNRDLIRSVGVAVWLDVPLKTAWERCGSDPSRPLAADRKAFEALYRRRRPDYLEADLRVETEGKTPDRIAAEIERRLSQRKGADDGMDQDRT